MIRRRRVLPRVVAAVAALMLAACSAPADEPGAGGSAGEPVAGGTGTILVVSEPRSLDPALMGHSASTNAVLGSALYGSLMINDVETGEITYKMAESFTSEDGGKTFELTLREGLTFSDGTPLDAAAVKFNWDRLLDPDLGSPSIRDAAAIESTEVVDPRTLKVTLRAPIPKYAQSVVTSSMDWIASPEALQAGQRSFDQNPVGAGPFMLESWTRQDKMELVKNPNYWDAPKPYLDGLTMRAVGDTTQRMNTLISGGAHVAINTNWASVASARDKGFAVEVVPMGGGQAMFMNTRRAPFDDVRARQAIAAAIDLEAVDLAVYEGEGEVPTTLFKDSSPFYSDIPLAEHGKGEAQKLFDELAAEGKEVSFTFTAYNTQEGLGVAEAVQAQLAAFDNVEVDIKTIELSEIPQIYGTNDYDMIVSSAQTIDPEPQLWTAFHGDSSANRSGINDPRLNKALDEGRLGETTEERKPHYDEVQQLLAELVPALFYTRTSSAAVTGENTHGVVQYGFGAILPEELWIRE